MRAILYVIHYPFNTEWLRILCSEAITHLFSLLLDPTSSNIYTRGIHYGKQGVRDGTVNNRSRC